MKVLLLSGSNGVVGAVELLTPSRSIARMENNGLNGCAMTRRYVLTKISDVPVYIRQDDGLSPKQAMEAIVAHAAKTAPVVQ